MKKRELKSKFWWDPNLAKVSREARYFWLGLVSCADDYGFCLIHTTWLAKEIYPFDDDVIDKIPGWLRELIDAQLIVYYSVHATPYCRIRRWNQWQNIQKKAAKRYPRPPTKDDGQKVEEEQTEPLPDWLRKSSDPITDAQRDPEDENLFGETAVREPPYEPPQDESIPKLALPPEPVKPPTKCDDLKLVGAKINSRDKPALWQSAIDRYGFDKIHDACVFLAKKGEPAWLDKVISQVMAELADKPGGIDIPGLIERIMANEEKAVALAHTLHINTNEIPNWIRNAAPGQIRKITGMMGF